jgi:hypothetical protein
MPAAGQPGSVCRFLIFRLNEISSLGPGSPSRPLLPCYPQAEEIMSAKKTLRALQNRANAQHSTGPKTQSGKQKSSFNALKHNLTGQSLILQPNEYDAYDRLTRALREELEPKTEMERQTVQKIIDTNFRLNRIAGLENNMLNFGLWENQRETESDERLDVMKAQTLAWMERAKSFDLLGRYESRLTKQLLAFTRELD